MKKRNIINLIKYHAEKNEAGFRSEAAEIAREFDAMGDAQLAQYIMAQISGTHLFAPQVADDEEAWSRSFESVPLTNTDPLPLPQDISDDLENIVRVVSLHRGLHKFLLQGAPGTGKTESVRQIARVLGRKLYAVDFSRLIDSRLGQTQKNVVEVFSAMKLTADPSQYVFLLDEIDALALDRTNSQDVREMGRVTSTLLKALDELPETVLLFATTNLFDRMDAALVRRFDMTVDFNRYRQEDLVEIAENLLDFYLKKYGCSGRKAALFRKIITLKSLPMPAEIKNRIRLATAFSLPGENFDYMPKHYKAFTGRQPTDVKTLKDEGFTLREIEILTGISKSRASRELKEKTNE